MSIRATKQFAYEYFKEPDLEKSMQAHYSAVKELFGSEDFIEGPVAFAEKDFLTGKVSKWVSYLI